MDFLRPENLLRFGYKDCVLCDVERKGEEKRCNRCSGRLGRRDRLLWEINRRRIRGNASRFALLWPGAGHIYSGRFLFGFFWAILIPLAMGLAINVWQGPSIRASLRMIGDRHFVRLLVDCWQAMTYGHIVLAFSFIYIWHLSRRDALRGANEVLAPCHEACPSGVNIPDYVALVREGKPQEALSLVHERLPFAAFCGRACPHPCEQKCVRNEFDAPISIMSIKRHAAESGYSSGILPSSEICEGVPTPRIAVIGAGPAGLSAANTLACLGCRVTVFDENEEPGGMMRYGVTEFRFPVDALLEDVRTVFARGVHFEGGKKLGADLTFSDLEKQGFQAIMVSVGTSEAVRIPGTGGEKEGFHDALTFLARVKKKSKTHIHGKLVVIGGGNVAIDVARTAVRLGIRDVTIACLESRETMPASPWEVEEALAEGIKILPGTAVKKYLVRNGAVYAFEALRVEKIEFDPKGRIVPKTVPGSEFEVSADTVIMAVGSRAKLDFLPTGVQRKTTDSAHHVCRLIFKGKEIKIPVYMFGDCVRGPASVVAASASGRAAALGLYEVLCPEEVVKARYKDNFRRLPEAQVTDRPEWRTRRHGARLSPEESLRSFAEIEKGFTGECARLEAERCARCNLRL